MWELIDDGSFNGVKKYLKADGDNVSVRYEQDDVKPHIDRNKAAQNEDFDKRSELWHAASIPVGIMYEWIAKHGVNCWNPDHADGVKKLLNSGEYRYLKVKNIIL